MGRDAFEQNAQSMKHSQKAKDTSKATATASHFVDNSDMNKDWTLVQHFWKASGVFFVHLSKTGCILGRSCREFIFLPRLVKWVWVLRTYLIQAVTPASELGRNLPCLLKHIWCQNCCTLVVFLRRKLSCLRFQNPCGPKGILQGSNKDFLKFNSRQKSHLAWRSHPFYPGVQRSPHHQRNNKNIQACNKGHHFLTSVKRYMPNCR